VMVRHTHRVLETLQDLLFAADGVDSNARGYGQTGLASYLQSYRINRQSVERDRATVRELTVDNPLQQLRIPELERLTSQKIARAEAIIHRRGSNGSDATEVVKSGTDDAIDDQFLKGSPQLAGRRASIAGIAGCRRKPAPGPGQGSVHIFSSTGWRAPNERKIRCCNCPGT
jgi:CHASE3 domain sensor protein